jgi:hypothetical protein
MQLHGAAAPVVGLDIKNRTPGTVIVTAMYDGMSAPTTIPLDRFRNTMISLQRDGNILSKIILAGKSRGKRRITAISPTQLSDIGKSQPGELGASTAPESTTPKVIVENKTLNPISVIYYYNLFKTTGSVTLKDVKQIPPEGSVPIDVYFAGLTLDTLSLETEAYNPRDETDSTDPNKR